LNESENSQRRYQITSTRSKQLPL